MFTKPNFYKDFLFSTTRMFSNKWRSPQELPLNAMAYYLTLKLTFPLIQ